MCTLECDVIFALILYSTVQASSGKIARANVAALMAAGENTVKYGADI
jgi:hypothetical protein